ncbi:MAG TPA: Gfo/Idh/MocA family oxidoreductase [Saprospiraceae bacterium]|nr:Gfo/Idh/MocA family oxidoreductase [Saprospiraceae bacterium]
MKRKIRYGMIGGGQGAFIGGVHRMAAGLDGQMELVCGAFSSNPDQSKVDGQSLFLPVERCYGDFKEMILRESLLPDGDRMDIVSIVTPNHLHFEPAMMALEHGFHVICDKPLCISIDEAYQLRARVKSSGLIFALTHNYTGYPMVKQAREMISHGELGKIRRIVVEYPQGWLSTAIESNDQKQASWRTDPTRAGMAGAMGDIGTHAENLAEYVTGLSIDELCADLYTHVEGRKLDDDGSVLMRMNNGARGVLYASQISAGEENNLSIKVYGESGGLEWSQMEPNTLIVRWLNKPMQIFRTGVGNLYPLAQRHTRLPSGHPEGYIEAFANIYRNVAYCIQARISHEEVDPVYLDFPGVDDGVRGMEFIEAVVKSGKQNEVKWMQMKKTDKLNN